MTDTVIITPCREGFPYAACGLVRPRLTDFAPRLPHDLAPMSEQVVNRGFTSRSHELALRHISGGPSREDPHLRQHGRSTRTLPVNTNGTSCRPLQPGAEQRYGPSWDLAVLLRGGAGRGSLVTHRLRADNRGGRVALSFAAIDVETANSSRGSICSIGVAVVDAGELVAQHHFLCQPPESLHWFDGINISIHGIRPQDVANEPPFTVRLRQALDVVGELPVIAHNAAFDIGAIRSACDADGSDWPTLRYACSLVMARRSSLGLLSYRLPLVCEALSVSQGQHHRADEDAAAAALIVRALAQRACVDSLDDLATSLMVRLGRITQVDWTGCVSKGRPAPPSANAEADPDHPFYGQEIAFTGGLSILRAEAMALVAALGGTPQTGPTKITDFLVIGDGFTGNSAAEFHTGKAAKAVKINSKGGRIEVLTEGDFLALVADATTSGVRIPDQREPASAESAPGPRAASR